MNQHRPIPPFPRAELQESLNAIKQLANHLHELHAILETTFQQVETLINQANQRNKNHEDN